MINHTMIVYRATASVKGKVKNLITGNIYTLVRLEEERGLALLQGPCEGGRIITIDRLLTDYCDWNHE